MITLFFLGVILGAIIQGEIPPNTDGNFYEIFVSPWFNLFPVATGMFITVLFGWLAAIYLTGEAKDDEGYYLFAKTSYFFLILLILSGIGVFLTSEISGIYLFAKFLQSSISIGCVIIFTLLIPLLLRNIKRRNSLMTRFIAELQTASLLRGWFAVQFPVMIFIKGGTNLTIWNSQAPDRTLEFLSFALVVDIVLVLPAFAYLFKIFKFDNGDQD